MKTYRGEVAICHPPFLPTSKAKCLEIDEPLINVQDILYSPEDDAILEKWLRENVETTWHSFGTCKMAASNDLRAVDGSLSVYGVKGLKIADLSVVPADTAANTNNLALAIGEKAADIFMAELSR